MELLLFVLALIVMSVLAIRFGQDSRPTVDSKEQTWSRFGTTHELVAPAETQLTSSPVTRPAQPSSRRATASAEAS
jgi:hypothetical protein